MGTWLKRLSLGAAGLVALTLVAGAAYEQIARIEAPRSYPAPGRLVDIGGRRIELDCRGSGSPVVVFEAGLDGLGSLSWASVQGEVAKTTRACSYSRAGIMWSDASGRPFSSIRVAEDLHDALAAAGEKPPYVLVAHSLGGPYALVFAARYAGDVAGLVFVDASHPEQIERLRAATGGKDLDASGQIKLGAALAWTGVTRLVVALNGRAVPAGAPQWIDKPNRAFLPQALAAMLAENNALSATLAEAGKSRDLGNRPLFVLTHGAKFPAAVLKAQGIDPAGASRLDAAWLKLQDDEATWSSRSHHEIVAGASHYIQFDRPDAVIDAVRTVVAEVRKER